ncbi:MAG: sensor histidine kinase [Actinobacteria bacterium]|nr:sensor histidine kinase [Actinomycetota bacterium]
MDQPTLSRLTGVRSGKQSYYAELRRTEARMTSAVQALEGISGALVRTRDDPRALLEEVLRAAAGHLRADWTLIALRDGELPALDMRFLATDPDGALIESVSELPDWLTRELAKMRGAADPSPATGPGWVQVPMTLDGAVLGRLIAHYDHSRQLIEHADLWVLRILADQAAVSMHTATLYATGADLRLRAQQLYDEIARSSQDLRTRTAELERAEGRLRVLHQRELLDAERHRIALELHDSVAQYVLSAGLAVEVCRAEAADRGDGDGAQRLVDARDLIAKAGDQVRSVIYALNHEPRDGKAPILSELLHGLAAQHRPNLDVSVRLEGRPQPMSPIAEHALARIAGEALFNVSLHAKATRAVIRVRYAPAGTSMWISDDGSGDPAQLRRLLRLTNQADSDGRHQGLANMARRAQELGGSFAVGRAKLGGIRLEIRIPPENPGPGSAGPAGSTS